MKFAYSKVPKITGIFWLTKILTTGMGETLSDFFAHTIGPYIAVIGSGLLLLAALYWQLNTSRYKPWPYWSAVVMVSVCGTMVADVIHIGLGVPYLVSTAGFAVLLAMVFALWYYLEGSLSIHGIKSRRRELFYWATVMGTFALGTAAGDATAMALGWGYLGSGFVFAALILVPVAVFGLFKRFEIATFWAAYILTRPLGASFADWIAVSNARGGMNLGTGLISVLLLAVIAALVGYLAKTHLDEERLALNNIDG